MDYIIDLLLLQLIIFSFKPNIRTMKIYSIGTIAAVMIGLLLGICSCKETRPTVSKKKVVAAQPVKKVVKEKVKMITKKTTNRPSVNIVENQKVSSPLEILLNSKGLWLAHEGEVGIVTLVDDRGKEIVKKILSSADGNWMTSGPAKYKANMTFDAKGAKRGKLIFKGNPGPGEGREAGKSTSFEIPVTFE